MRILLAPQALLLARGSKTPAIIVRGSEASPFLVSPFFAQGSVPGAGEFSCCRRGHVIKGQSIECDKKNIAPMINDLLQSRRQHALEQDQDVLMYRWWSAYASPLMLGLPSPGGHVLPRTLAKFLSEFHFENVTSEQNTGTGLTPLHFCVITGNLIVVDEILSCEDVDVNARGLGEYPLIGVPKGTTPIHMALARCTIDAHGVISRLIAKGADPNSLTCAGATPLIGGAASSNVSAIRSLIAEARDEIDLERGYLNDGTCLSIACFVGNLETVRTLLEAGASVTHVNYHGGHKLTGKRIALMRATRTHATLLCTRVHRCRRE